MDSTLFHDVEALGELDVKEVMADFAYGFKYKGKPIDLHDNEYLYFTALYKVKMTEFDKFGEELGVHDCTATSHLSKTYDLATIKKKFGTLYCANPLTDEQKVQGMSQLGYPVKRLYIDLDYCNQDHLIKIGSKKICKDKADLWKDEIFKDLHMTVHYDRTMINLNNIDGVYGMKNLTEGLMVKDNEFIHRVNLNSILMQ